MPVSDNAKQHLSWILDAAKNNQLAALSVTHKETGEERALLTVVLEKDGTYEFYPLALIFEDMHAAMNEWVPPNEVNTGESDVSGQGTSGEGLGLSNEGPSGADSEVHE